MLKIQTPPTSRFVAEALCLATIFVFGGPGYHLILAVLSLVALCLAGIFTFVGLAYEMSDGPQRP